MSTLKVRVYPDRTGQKYGSYGNIMWPGKFAMRGDRFPANHPVGGGFCDSGDGQCGNGANIIAFRERGYWASCFPEGDGITWKRTGDQTDAQCLIDIREAFGWDAEWNANVKLEQQP